MNNAARLNGVISQAEERKHTCERVAIMPIASLLSAILPYCLPLVAAGTNTNATTSEDIPQPRLKVASRRFDIGVLNDNGFNRQLYRLQRGFWGNTVQF